MLERCNLKLPVELKPIIDRALKLAAEEADKEPNRSKLSAIVKKHYYGLAAGEQGWQSHKWPCLHPKCKKKKVIGSHVLQSAGPIAALAEPIPSDPKSSVVITPLWDAVKHNKIGRPVAQTEASKFPGFCHCHDSTLFKELENPGGEKTDKGRHLQAYRSFCREMRRVEASNHSVSTAVKCIKDEQRTIIRNLFSSYIPTVVLAEYPDIADMKLVLNAFKYADYERQFYRQQQFFPRLLCLSRHSMTS